jgi:oxygen-independent coproporphyrinogen-3 oxidase
VPWTSRGQRLFDENDLPTPEDKLQLYLKGKELLTAAGYVDIGMDHFALITDDLYTAWKTASCTAILWVTPHNILLCCWD